MEPLRCVVASPLSIAYPEENLMAAPETDAILGDRVRAWIRRPEEESVLLLAHGFGEEERNAALLARMQGLGDRLREEFSLAAVQGMALREDWPEHRAEEEARIRAWVGDQAAAGRRVLVLPFPVSGFGLWIPKTPRDSSCTLHARHSPALPGRRSILPTSVADPGSHATSRPSPLPVPQPRVARD